MGGTKGRLSVEPGPWQVGEVPGPRQGWHTGVCLAEPGPTWELSLWPTEGSGKGRSSDEPDARHHRARHPCKGDSDESPVRWL